MKPLVSIIVPVYNVEDFLLKCLDSLTVQTYDNIELVIVDDGSTDKSVNICDEFVKSEKRARVFHKKNGGLSSARNFGIKHAKGEYICLVDSDDYVKKEFVESMMDAILGKSADVAICGYNKDVPEERVLTGEEAAIRLLISQENMEIIAWNKMYRRGLFDEIEYPEGSNYEDNLTTYKLLSKAKRVIYVARSLYEYVERSGSITKNDKKEEKLKYRERAAEEAMKYFENNQKLRDAAEIAMLTAKLAYVDFAINGRIEKNCMDYGIKWIRVNKMMLLKNSYLSKKLRLYIYLITSFKAKPYIFFRKIRHE